MAWSRSERRLASRPNAEPGHARLDTSVSRCLEPPAAWPRTACERARRLARHHRQLADIGIASSAPRTGLGDAGSREVALRTKAVAQGRLNAESTRLLAGAHGSALKLRRVVGLLQRREVVVKRLGLLLAYLASLALGRCHCQWNKSLPSARRSSES